MDLPDTWKTMLFTDGDEEDGVLMNINLDGDPSDGGCGRKRATGSLILASRHRAGSRDPTVTLTNKPDWSYRLEAVSETEWYGWWSGGKAADSILTTFCLSKMSLIHANHTHHHDDRPERHKVRRMDEKKKQVAFGTTRKTWSKSIRLHYPHMIWNQDIMMMFMIESVFLSCLHIICPKGSF